MQACKIIFVTNNYLPYAGGVVSSLLAFKQALQNLGHRVHIITLDFNGVKNDDVDVTCINCPIKFLYKDNPMALPLHATEQICEIITQFKPDIVHSQHPFLLGTAAQKVCKKLDVPLVFTHHTQYDKYAHYVPLPERFTVPVINRLVQAYCKKCSLVFAPTNSIKRQLHDIDMAMPVEVLPSPILPIFAQAMPQFELKRSSEKRKLLSVSRFVPEKNINALLDMFVQLDKNKYQLTLVGYGYYQAMLERYAFGWHALSREAVSFVVKPPKDVLCDQYRHSDLFVFASQSETQGLVLAEAMACGTPVIALRGPGQDDVIVNGVNGFLVDNIADMREMVAGVMSNHDLFATLQQGAWQTGQRYRADVLATRLVEQYCQLMA